MSHHNSDKAAKLDPPHHNKQQLLLGTPRKFQQLLNDSTLKTSDKLPNSINPTPPQSPTPGRLHSNAREQTRKFYEFRSAIYKQTQAGKRQLNFGIEIFSAFKAKISCALKLSLLANSCEILLFSVLLFANSS